ncbi:hypothetical protein ACJJTC_003555 [Scirpophaga incertulas]
MIGLVYDAARNWVTGAERDSDVTITAPDSGDQVSLIRQPVLKAWRLEPAHDSWFPLVALCLNDFLDFRHDESSHLIEAESQVCAIIAARRFPGGTEGDLSQL